MEYKDRNGILIPSAMKVGSWIVTGTPGCGKTWLMERIRGYPGEVGIDISIKKWWSIPPLAQRPREIHLSLPFVGHADRFPVYDDLWTKTDPKNLPEVDLERIRIPNKKKFFLATDWRARFVFDFILPPPDWIFKTRRRRLREGDEKLVDVGISEKLVAWQVATLWKVAWHFHRSELQVLVRPFNQAYPYCFAEIVEAMRKKPGKKGAVSVFPDGVDMGVEMSLRKWIKRTAPKGWIKSILKENGPPKAA